MKNKSLSKLRSRTGASITFALLLFLVCAVLCSVILTAATASAGRMSGIAETDQRYYAVTSAAELLKNTLCGKTVSIVKITTTRTETEYRNDIPGTPENHLIYEGLYLFVDMDENAITEAYLEGHPDNQITPNNEIEKAGILNDLAYNYYNNISISNRKLMISSSDALKSALSFEDEDPLKIIVEESLNPADGTLKLVLHNDHDDKFKQELLFTASGTTGGSTSSENLPAEGYSENGNEIIYTIKKVTTNIEIKSYKWALASVKTLTAS